MISRNPGATEESLKMSVSGQSVALNFLSSWSSESAASGGMAMRMSVFLPPSPVALAMTRIDLMPDSHTAKFAASAGIVLPR